MINKVELIGRLGADPEVKNLESGTKLVKISVGTTQYWNDKQSGERREETQWHHVSMFGKTAENAERLLKKGSLVFIDGSLKYRTVEDDNGQKTRYTDINARDFKILADGKRNENQNSGGNTSGAESSTSTSTSNEPVTANAGADTDDDLPF